MSRLPPHCLHTALYKVLFFFKVIFFLSCRSSLTTQTLGAKSWVSRLRAMRRSFFFFSIRCIRQHTLHTSARLYEGAKTFFLRLCGGSVKALSMLVRRVGIRQHTQHTSAYAAYVSIRSIRQQGSMKASAKRWATDGSIKALLRLLRLCQGSVKALLRLLRPCEGSVKALC